MYEDPYSNNIYIATENSGLIILNSELEINQSYKFDVFDPSTISTNNLISLLDTMESISNRTRYGLQQIEV